MVATANISETCENSHSETKDIVILILAYTLCFALPIAFKHTNLPINLKVLAPMVTDGILIFGYFYLYLARFGKCAIFQDPLNRKLFDVEFP